MKDIKNSNNKDEKKVYLKFKKMIFSDINIDKYNNKSKIEKSKNNIKKKKKRKN